MNMCCVTASLSSEPQTKKRTHDQLVCTMSLISEDDQENGCEYTDKWTHAVISASYQQGGDLHEKSIKKKSIYI